MDESGTLRIVAEFVNELLDVADLIELAFTSLGSILVLLSFGSLKHLEIAAIVGKFLCLEVDNLLNCGVKEVTSVRDDDDSCLIELLDVAFEPDESWDIQVIRRLVKKQDFRLSENDLRDGDSHSPST